MSKSETSIVLSSIPSYDEIIENLAKTLYESSRGRSTSLDEEKFPDWNSLLNGGSTADYILANYRLLAVESLEFFIEMFKNLGISSDHLQKITSSLENLTEKLIKLTSDEDLMLNEDFDKKAQESGDSELTTKFTAPRGKSAKKIDLEKFK